VLIHRGLEKTAALFPAVRAGFRWLRRVTRLLANERGLSGTQVRKRLRVLLGKMRAEAERAAQEGRQELADDLRHFVKVSRSYEPGLFYCYDIAELPRTNNDLEHLFGSHRYHERRSSGRKGASPGLSVRGSVRVVAGVATRLRAVSGEELSPTDPEAWRQLRQRLGRRQEARRRQRRFRRNSKAYLRDLERKARQSHLPP
jgi:hypothetical protein